MPSTRRSEGVLAIPDRAVGWTLLSSLCDMPAEEQEIRENPMVRRCCHRRCHCRDPDLWRSSHRPASTQILSAIPSSKQLLSMSPPSHGKVSAIGTTRSPVVDCQDHRQRHEGRRSSSSSIRVIAPLEQDPLHVLRS